MQIISCQAVVANMDMLRQARIVTASGQRPDTFVLHNLPYVCYHF